MTLQLKYTLTDAYNQTIEREISINVSKDMLNIPQMQIMPTDPTFNPNHQNRNANVVKNRTDYLKILKMPEVRAMGEAMVR